MIKELSKPIKIEKTKLAKLLYMPKRKDNNKKGRDLFVLFNNEIPYFEDFQINFSYYVKFLEDNNIAGNHYHLKKHELMRPLIGKVEINLEDINTKEREVINLNANDNVFLYVKPKISHNVKANKKGDILLVLANCPSKEVDEIEYDV